MSNKILHHTLHLIIEFKTENTHTHTHTRTHTHTHTKLLRKKIREKRKSYCASYTIFEGGVLAVGEYQFTSKPEISAIFIRISKGNSPDRKTIWTRKKRIIMIACLNQTQNDGWRWQQETAHRSILCWHFENAYILCTTQPSARGIRDVDRCSHIEQSDTEMLPLSQLSCISVKETISFNCYVRFYIVLLLLDI